MLLQIEVLYTRLHIPRNLVCHEIFFLWSLRNKGWDMDGTGKDNWLRSFFFINRLFTKILKQMVDNCPNVSQVQSSGVTGAKNNWDPQAVVLMAIMTVVLFHVTITERLVAGRFIFWSQMNADRLLLTTYYCTAMQLKPILGLKKLTAAYHPFIACKCSCPDVYIDRKMTWSIIIWAHIFLEWGW